MKDLKDTGYFSYDDLIESMEHEVLLTKSDEDYQGDSYYLLGDAFGRVGYLQFGWGSCSGCDALEACEGSVVYATTLRDDLHNEIKWFDTRAEAMEWFNSHDWEGDWSWSSAAVHAFVDEARKLLAGVAA